MCITINLFFTTILLYIGTFFFLEMNLAAGNKTFRQNQYNIVK